MNRDKWLDVSQARADYATGNHDFLRAKEAIVEALGVLATRSVPAAADLVVLNLDDTNKLNVLSVRRWYYVSLVFRDTCESDTVWMEVMASQTHVVEPCQVQLPTAQCVR